MTDVMGHLLPLLRSYQAQMTTAKIKLCQRPLAIPSALLIPAGNMAPVNSSNMDILELLRLVGGPTQPRSEI